MARSDVLTIKVAPMSPHHFWTPVCSTRFWRCSGLFSEQLSFVYTLMSRRNSAWKSFRTPTAWQGNKIKLSASGSLLTFNVLMVLGRRYFTLAHLISPLRFRSPFYSMFPRPGSDLKNCSDRKCPVLSWLWLFWLSTRHYRDTFYSY